MDARRYMSSPRQNPQPTAYYQGYRLNTRKQLYSNVNNLVVNIFTEFRLMPLDEPFDLIKAFDLYLALRSHGFIILSPADADD